MSSKKTSKAKVKESGTMSDEIRRNRRGSVSEPEPNDGIPVEAQPGQGHGESMEEMMKRFVREEVSRAAEKNDMDSFTESDDFEEEDPNVLPLTHHEVIAMTDEELSEYAPDGVTLTDEEAPQESPDGTEEKDAFSEAPDEGSAPAPEPAQAPQEDHPPIG